MTGDSILPLRVASHRDGRNGGGHGARNKIYLRRFVLAQERWLCFRGNMTFVGSQADARKNRRRRAGGRGQRL